MPAESGRSSRSWLRLRGCDSRIRQPTKRPHLAFWPSSLAPTREVDGEGGLSSKICYLGASAGFLFFRRLLVLPEASPSPCLRAARRHPARLVLGLGAGSAAGGGGRRRLEPFRRHVAERMRLRVPEQTRPRLSRLAKADDHSRRGREVKPVIEAIDDVQVEVTQGSSPREDGSLRGPRSCGPSCDPSRTSRGCSYGGRAWSR